MFRHLDPENDLVRFGFGRDSDVQQYISDLVEGLNLRINRHMRKTYESRSFNLLQITLFHRFEDLPESNSPTASAEEFFFTLIDLVI